VFGAVAGLIGCLAGGCVVSDSDTIQTSGMWVHFAVEQRSESQAVAWAHFRVTSSLGNVIRLTGGDRIECNGTRMTEYFEPITGYHWSRAIIAPATSGYEFVFVRPGERVTSHLPWVDEPTFLGTAPAGQFGPLDELEVYWDDLEPADSITLDVDGECIQAVFESGLDDDGQAGLAPIEADPLHPGACDVTVTVTRHARGDVAQAFRDGAASSSRASSGSLRFQP
jgi:hypothetical protein